MAVLDAMSYSLMDVYWRFGGLLFIPFPGYRLGAAHSSKISVKVYQITQTHILTVIFTDWDYLLFSYYYQKHMTFIELASFSKSLTFIGLHQSHSIDHSYLLSYMWCSHSHVHCQPPFPTSSSFPSTASDIQHFLNTLTVTYGEISCHDHCHSSSTHRASLLFQLVSEHGPLPRAIPNAVVSNGPFNTYYSRECVIIRSSHQEWPQSKLFIAWFIDLTFNVKWL